MWFKNHYLVDLKGIKNWDYPEYLNHYSVLIWIS